MTPIRYISAGPLPATVNPSAMQASGAATSAIGQTIAGIGDAGLRVAEKIRRIDEQTKMEEAFSTMELEASKFSTDLMGREDTDQWGQEWGELSQSFQSLPQLDGLSPEGKAAFKNRFTDWNTRRTIHLETLAANKKVELGKARLENSLAAYDAAGNIDAARDAITNAPTELLSTPDKERILFELDQKEQHNGIIDEIDTDPRAFLELYKEGIPGVAPEKFAQYTRYADKAARELDVVNSNDILNRIVTGEITDKAQIDDLGFYLPPTKRLSLYNTLERWQAETDDRERRKPEFIQKKIGQFYNTLQDWNPNDEQMDQTAVELGFFIDSVPPGPYQDQMKRMLAAKRNEFEDVRSYREKAADEALKAAFAERLKEPDATKFTLKEALDDGWLKDHKKLWRTGFPEDVARKIARTAREEGNPAAAKLLKDNWKDRERTNAQLDPFNLAVADAIRLENAYVDWKKEPSAEAMGQQQEALREYGEAKIKISDWIRENPDKDPEDFIGRLLGAPARKAYLKSKNTPRPEPFLLPTGPSMPTDGQEFGTEPEPPYDIDAMQDPSTFER